MSGHSSVIRFTQRVFATLVLLALFFTARASGEAAAMPSADFPKALRTVMLYMVGSNLESEMGGGKWATNDLKEILQAQVPLDQVNVVLCAGGSNRWHSMDLSEGEVCVFVLTADRDEYRFVPIVAKERKSMGEASTLSGFLKDCTSLYPAQSYDLIVWDHGGGPLAGFGEDEAHENDALTVTEFITALSDSPFASEPLALIGFDCCLMGNLEIAAALAPYASRMIASEETDRAGSWDWHFLGESVMTEDTDAIAKRICETHNAYLNRLGLPGTLACYDLSRASEVCESLNAVFSEPVPVPDKLAQIVSSVSSAKQMDCWGSRSGYDLYDLSAFAKALCSIDPEKAGALQSALNKMLVCISCSETAKGLNGISFYFPMTNSTHRDQDLDRYELVSSSLPLHHYQLFLRQYEAYSRSAMSDAQPLRATVSVQSDGTRLFRVYPDEALLHNMVRAAYLILSENEEGIYLWHEMGRGFTETADGVLELSLSPTVPMIQGSADQPWDDFTLLEAERFPGEIRYNLPLSLIRGFSILNAHAMLQTDCRNGTMNIVSVHLDRESEMANPVYDEFQPDDYLWALCEARYYTEDSDGKPLPYTAWTRVPSLFHSETLVSKGGPKIAMQPCREGVAYYIQIVVTDAAGVAHVSSLLPFADP